MTEYLHAFLGGLLIGVAALLMLLFNGKILGISGIVGGLLKRGPEQRRWRILFLVGLFVGSGLLLAIHPDAFRISFRLSPAVLVLAGLLVGYGTRLGGGCTSGHGVCGVSRLSPRSLMATATFIGCGALTVFIVRQFFGDGL